jgi:hypothetical protein
MKQLGKTTCIPFPLILSTGCPGQPSSSHGMHAVNQVLQITVCCARYLLVVLAHTQIKQNSCVLSLRTSLGEPCETMHEMVLADGLL